MRKRGPSTAVERPLQGRVLGCWRESNCPPPCFMKVCDFDGDKVECFDRDLNVVILWKLGESGCCSLNSS